VVTAKGAASYHSPRFQLVRTTEGSAQLRWAKTQQG